MGYVDKNHIVLELLNNLTVFSDVALMFTVHVLKYLSSNYRFVINATDTFSKTIRTLVSRESHFQTRNNVSAHQNMPVSCVEYKHGRKRVNSLPVSLLDGNTRKRKNISIVVRNARTGWIHNKRGYQ